MTTDCILFCPYQFFPICLYPPLVWSVTPLQKALSLKKPPLAALSTPLIYTGWHTSLFILIHAFILYILMSYLLHSWLDPIDYLEYLANLWAWERHQEALGPPGKDNLEGTWSP